MRRQPDELWRRGELDDRRLFLAGQCIRRPRRRATTQIIAVRSLLPALDGSYVEVNDFAGSRLRRTFAHRRCNIFEDHSSFSSPVSSPTNTPSRYRA